MNAELESKALALAKADNDANGGYMNAPYQLYHNGERYIAYLRHSESKSDREKRVYLEIMRPAQHQGNVTLEVTDTDTGAPTRRKFA